jgi:hypothetical protein
MMTSHVAVGLEVAVDEMEAGVVAEAEAEDDAEAVAELEDVDVGDDVLLPVALDEEDAVELGEDDPDAVAEPVDVAEAEEVALLVELEVADPDNEAGVD